MNDRFGGNLVTYFRLNSVEREKKGEERETERERERERVGRCESGPGEGKRRESAGKRKTKVCRAYGRYGF